MPQSIYTGLLNLGQEDFLTELFIRTLERSRTNSNILCQAFLNKLTGINGLNIVDIQSQVTHGNRRIDIEIRATDASGEERLIFIENKVGSTEGDRQLPDYAQILSNLVLKQKISRGHIIYLTVYYEPKERQVVLAGTDKVDFFQCRWGDIYNVLVDTLPKVHIEDRILLQEFTSYLKENGMSKQTTFSPIDLVGLTRMPALVSILEDCLRDEVWERYCNYVGENKPMTGVNWVSSLRSYNSFKYYSSDEFWVSIGFNLKEEYSEASIWIGASSRHPRCNEVFQATKKYADASNDVWKYIEVDNRKGMAANQSLKTFLTEDNHVDVIRKWFIKKMDDLDEFRKEYPNLPWWKSKA